MVESALYTGDASHQQHRGTLPLISVKYISITEAEISDQTLQFPKKFLLKH